MSSGPFQASSTAIPVTVLAGVVSATVALTPLALDAQSSHQTAWTLPRTSSGQPNLQGHWTNTTAVPLRRPEHLGNQEFYFPDEAEEAARNALLTNETEPGTNADVHYQLDEFGLDRTQTTLVTNLRTSIIVDPPNGRFPPVTAGALAKAAAAREYERAHGFDSARDRPLTERCIFWDDAGPPMLPMFYSSNYQIMQTDDYVVIVIEMIHDARIIPLNRREHLPPHISQWFGDSLGRWEGDTLVVETTNFSGEVRVRPSGNVFINKDARITERFTRTADDVIEYEFTVDDPQTWQQPWSGTYPFAAIEGPMFEYACHEGNYGLANILRGARADERKAVDGN